MKNIFAKTEEFYKVEFSRIEISRQTEAGCNFSTQLTEISRQTTDGQNFVKFWHTTIQRFKKRTSKRSSLFKIRIEATIGDVTTIRSFGGNMESPRFSQLSENLHPGVQVLVFWNQKLSKIIK